MFLEKVTALLVHSGQTKDRLPPASDQHTPVMAYGVFESVFRFFFFMKRSEKEKKKYTGRREVRKSLCSCKDVSAVQHQQHHSLL